MQNTLIGDTVYTVLTSDEVKQIICDKYGTPVETISVSGATICTKLIHKDEEGDKDGR